MRRLADLLLLGAALLGAGCGQRLYSRKCRDALMFWHRDSGSCRLCADEYPIAAGFEFSPNCGLQDDGGRLDRPYQECGAGTFNDGSRARCQRCTLCPARQGLRGCSSTQDACCCGEGEWVVGGRCQPACCLCPSDARAESRSDQCPQPLFSCLPKDGEQCQRTEEGRTTTTSPPLTETPTPVPSTVPETAGPTTRRAPVTQTPARTPAAVERHGSLMIPAVVAAVVFLVCTIVICCQWKRCTGDRNSMTFSRCPGYCEPADPGTHYLTQSVSSSPQVLANGICASPGKVGSRGDLEDSLLLLPGDKNLSDIMPPELQEAPLQAVLDNLDVLEELIMLLDPESTVAKSTRHVAARCSFPATWITYTYSMRDSKSPLQAVLEGVAAKWPDWTVGHLARLLSDIGRNDAVAALAKLPLPPSHTASYHRPLTPQDEVRSGHRELCSLFP
ncbi:IGF-like family receptor 1 isoform X2 [Lepisosteus oculatus]|uniref:IGF-like family receptor 1 isoform X2 n=1 Tax=Lepisosteus oculatus TaxID=7918 RepID=UPI003719B3DD